MKRYNEKAINERIQREQKNEYAREAIRNELKLDNYNKIQGISIDKAESAQKKNAEDSLKRECDDTYDFEMVARREEKIKQCQLLNEKQKEEKEIADEKLREKALQHAIQNDESYKKLKGKLEEIATLKERENQIKEAKLFKTQKEKEEEHLIQKQMKSILIKEEKEEEKKKKLNYEKVMETKKELQEQIKENLKKKKEKYATNKEERNIMDNIVQNYKEEEKKKKRRGNAKTKKTIERIPRTNRTEK